MSENKVGRYLKYAIGEIILVVIGILIAIQVNSWYEDSKKLKLKRVYTENLIQDLKNDLTSLNEQIQLNEQRFLTRLDSLIDQVENPASTVEDIKMLGKNNRIAGLRTTNKYNTNTFEVLISSGNIDLYDDSVIQEMMELSSMQNFQRRVAEGNSDFFFEMYNNYRAEYLTQEDFANQSITDALWENVDAYKHAPLFINTLQVRHHAITRYIELSSEIVIKTEELIKILEAEEE